MFKTTAVAVAVAALTLTGMSAAHADGAAGHAAVVTAMPRPTPGHIPAPCGTGTWLCPPTTPNPNLPVPGHPHHTLCTTAAPRVVQRTPAVPPLMPSYTRHMKFGCLPVVGWVPTGWSRWRS
jgi:hypothetical protein